MLWELCVLNMSVTPSSVFLCLDPVTLFLVIVSQYLVAVVKCRAVSKLKLDLNKMEVILVDVDEVTRVLGCLHLKYGSLVDPG